MTWSSSREQAHDRTRYDRSPDDRPLDWGIPRSLSAIGAEPGLRLVVVAGGMHLSGAHGHTIDVVRADGFDPHVLAALLALEQDAPDPPAADQAAGALAATGAWLREARPDALLLAGDRLETVAAAVAATVTAVPIVHLHGGEQTLGAPTTRSATRSPSWPTFTWSATRSTQRG